MSELESHSILTSLLLEWIKSVEKMNTNYLEVFQDTRVRGMCVGEVPVSSRYSAHGG